jgi:5-oxoprolinase (ATP-hydrolysing) subunit C
MPEVALTVGAAGRACVQDTGRAGWQAYGVPVRGSSDQYSSRLANVLVWNPLDLPVIEVTAFDFSVRAEDDVLMAVTGAECDVSVDGRPAPQWRPVPVARGSLIELGNLRRGLRCYLAINGSISAPRLLGSVAPDPSLEFGWYLRPGDTVVAQSAFTHYDHPHLRHPVLQPRVPVRSYSAEPTVQVTEGPDVDEFTAPVDVLARHRYKVGGQSNEIGLQLLGVAPARRTEVEILSRGVGIGAVEVTPSGDLAALLRGRLLTAGYPVVAVATTTSQSILGQLRPGEHVRFRFVAVQDAVRSARAERHVLEGVAAAMARIARSVGLDGTPTP